MDPNTHAHIRAHKSAHPNWLIGDGEQGLLVCIFGAGQTRESGTETQWTIANRVNRKHSFGGQWTIGTSYLSKVFTTTQEYESRAQIGLLVWDESGKGKKKSVQPSGRGSFFTSSWFGQPRSSGQNRKRPDCGSEVWKKGRGKEGFQSERGEGVRDRLQHMLALRWRGRSDRQQNEPKGSGIKIGSN